MFRYVKALINHKENCITIKGVQAIKMPKADDMQYFKNYHKGPAAPSVIYADFEAIIEKALAVNQIMINHILNHIQSIKTVDMDIRLSFVMMISTVNQFRYIEEKMLFISSWKNNKRSSMVHKMKCKHFNEDMILTKDDEQNFKNADKCYVNGNNSVFRTPYWCLQVVTKRQLVC